MFEAARANKADTSVTVHPLIESLTGNYSWNRIIQVKEDPLIPAYNTPEHKFNLGISCDNLKVFGVPNWNLGVHFLRIIQQALSPEEEAMSPLKKQLREPELELEILKKAISIFSRRDGGSLSS